MVSQSNLAITIISHSTITPSTKHQPDLIKLSVSDLPMLSCHYIQKGALFTKPQLPVNHLKSALSNTLAHFPPLAGRLITDDNGYVYVTCNDAGVDFIHADGTHMRLAHLLVDVPEAVKDCFAYDRVVSYEGHFRPILAVQVTELADGVFIGCSVNHAVADGTSFWNFFNTFAELSRGVGRVSKEPDFSRDSVLVSDAVLRLPEGGPKISFSGDAPVRERIFRFSRESILRLKDRVNNNRERLAAHEIMGKLGNDTLKFPNGKLTPLAWLRNAISRENQNSTHPESNDQRKEISSFQSLSALLWRGVTRARNLPDSKTTTFRMAVNCRHRLEPKLEPMYFGNAIQSVPTYALAGDVLGKDLRWCAEQLNKNVVAHGDAKVREYVENWERDPRCFPLGNFDGAMITMGSSPRFPMYDNDFGWGRPVAVRSGRANKFDGKISAFPGREGGGTVDLEVVLAPETMARLESDPEFMQYVYSS